MRLFQRCYIAVISQVCPSELSTCGLAAGAASKEKPHSRWASGARHSLVSLTGCYRTFGARPDLPYSNFRGMSRNVSGTQRSAAGSGWRSHQFHTQCRTVSDPCPTGSKIAFQVFHQRGEFGAEWFGHQLLQLRLQRLAGITAFRQFAADFGEKDIRGGFHAPSYRIGYALVTADARRRADRQLQRQLSVEEIAVMFEVDVGRRPGRSSNTRRSEADG